MKNKIEHGYVIKNVAGDVVAAFDEETFMLLLAKDLKIKEALTIIKSPDCTFGDFQTAMQMIKVREQEIIDSF
jgi:hypothetical protein